MPTKFQFDSVMSLLASGVKNYVTIRQQVGLTAEELDDIIENVDFYVKYFADQERAETLKKLNEEPKKKKWWQKK